MSLKSLKIYTRMLEIVTYLLSFCHLKLLLILVVVKSNPLCMKLDALFSMF